MKKLVAVCLVFAVMVVGLVPVNALTVYGGYAKVNMGISIKGKLMKFERYPVIKDGRMLVPARTASESMGAQVDWYEDEGKVDITRDETTVSMVVGSSSAVVNGVDMELDVEPFLANGTIMIPLRFIAEIFDESVGIDSRRNLVLIGGPLEDNTSRGDEGRAYKVVIDPGHGGYETGAIKYGLYEKNLNLDIAKRLNQLLTAEGIKTYMTRTDDSYVDLYDRSGLANSVNADLFISVHNNADDSSRLSGSMTLYYPGGSHTNGNLSPFELADIVQGELTGELGTRNLGVIQRPNLAVLRTTDMPAVIAEVGYMTNTSERGKLMNADFRQNAAEAIKNAVLTALKRI